MTGFTLTEDQQQVREDARKFAKEVLLGAPAEYLKFGTQEERFRSTRPLYQKAVAAGQIRAQIPIPAGGTGGSFVSTALQLEEHYAVDASVSLTIAATGLGLAPLIIAGNPDLWNRFLPPFLSGDGEPLASLVHSEPGGTANWLESGGNGLQTTAYEKDGQWIINGEKLWTTNSAGWDRKGADLQCVVCRYCEGGPESSPARDLRSSVVILIVTRENVALNGPSSYIVLDEPELVGHPAVSGPHTRFTNFKVPMENLLASPDSAVDIVKQSFGVSAAMVGGMAVGIMRAAFEKALRFAKTNNRGGLVPIIQRQSVADLLIKTKIKLDASRLLTWKALDSVQNGPGDEAAVLEACLQAKIFSSENAVKCVVSAMKVVGITSYASNHAFGRLLNDAACLPLFDGGNVGIRQRQYQSLLEDQNYQPWANL
ncbi:hypothetical protein ABOM_011146 [Aspergillus bombycis]|uniref:Acyl-CoA dehydrogenase n=1 Tax=Aspergillus bombycis TaxID=109264 RepID=A0A1F7ZMV4_9EURO|nr:hypothetical protein ABOM_011146 [Aspergillus bombycis]OGM40787.1 hypothetical protein ABOM_011146 [Aspergillus bombycis]